MILDMTVILVFSMFLETALQRLWIKRMHSMKIEQMTKLYGPAWHEKTKMGTPEMGGVVFIPVLLAALALAAFLVPGMDARRMLRMVSYPVLAAAVGLLDDWLKYRRHSSDGLKSLQKLFLQIAVTVPWAMWVLDGPFYLLPGIELPWTAAVLLVSFTGVGFQNAVNVTDGLDGLAAGCSFFSLIGAFLGGLAFAGAEPVYVLTLASGMGIALGFLWHNANPASVFMGDVGAHFFAGLLLSLCVNAGVFILIVPIGFLFGIEIISVAIQIVAIRKFKRKVFLMSPIHHHFEMLGWKETQIVTRFWIIHITGMAVCLSLLFLIALWV